MEDSFVVEKGKRLSVLQAPQRFSQKRTQTSEPPMFLVPEFCLPFWEGWGEGSGNQKVVCPELENTVDKAKDSLFEKNKSFAILLSYGILWNIFKNHTKESLEKRIEREVLKKIFFKALETKSLKERNRCVFWPPLLFLSLEQNGKWTLWSGYLSSPSFFNPANVFFLLL